MVVIEMSHALAISIRALGNDNIYTQFSSCVGAVVRRRLPWASVLQLHLSFHRGNKDFPTTRVQ